MKADLNYSPSDVFETFPFPQLTPPTQPTQLETIGEAYHEHRRQLMLARQEGLTKTYNRFHDPAESAEDIARLRQLHVEMDQAVLAAYGWAGEVTLDHAFRGEGKETRYTLSDGVKEELLRRLLLLNFEIAAREEAEARGSRGAGGKKGSREKGVRSKGKTKEKTSRPGGKKISGAKQPNLPGMEDDRPKQLGFFDED